MATPPDEAPAGHPSTKKIVALTVAAVLLALLLIGGGVAGGLLYHRQTQKTHHLQAEVTALDARLASLQTQATSAFNRGMKAQSAEDKAFGLTFKDGVASVFSGFSTPWQDGNWYAVKVEHGNNGHAITYRADMPQCELTYVQRNDVYTQGKAC